MPYINDYVFNGMSGLNDDNCYNTQKNVQNTNSGSYPLTNFFLNDTDMKSGLDLALSQPNINFIGGNQISNRGTNIDDNSNLLIGSTQTNPKCRIDLQERPYKTVPYLGRGTGDIDVECRLQQGDQITCKKSVTNDSEKSHMKYRNTPMLQELEHSITNPQHLIESEAHKDWVRGGQHTRDLFKEKSN